MIWSFPACTHTDIKANLDGFVYAKIELVLYEKAAQCS